MVLLGCCEVSVNRVVRISLWILRSSSCVCQELFDLSFGLVVSYKTDWQRCNCGPEHERAGRAEINEAQRDCCDCEQQICYVGDDDRLEQFSWLEAAGEPQPTVQAKCCYRQSGQDVSNEIESGDESHDSSF